MMRRKKVLGICGSTRSESVNHLILTSIRNLYSDRLDIDIFHGIADLPHFNPDIDDSAITPEVVNFRAAIEQADGILICTPEYVFSIPGSLKNALEWAVSTTIFSDKPVATIVASSSGDKAFESLSLIMSTMGASMTNDTQLLLRGARSAFDKKNNHFKPATVTLFHNLMNSLIEIMFEKIPLTEGGA
jgi:NAD(P)H-dependent FMN reductase